MCNRTQILSLSFPKPISNVTPAFSRLTFLQCHFFFNFYHIKGTQVPSTQNTKTLKYSRSSQYGAVLSLKSGPKTTPQLTLWLLVKNSDSGSWKGACGIKTSVAGRGGDLSLSRAIEENTDMNRIDCSVMR